jgi:hypothetical protein
LPFTDDIRANTEAIKRMQLEKSIKIIKKAIPATGFGGI